MLARLYTKEHEELGGKFASVDVQMGNKIIKFLVILLPPTLQSLRLMYPMANSLVTR